MSDTNDDTATLETAVVRYHPVEAEIAKWRADFSDLEATTPEGYEAVKRALSVTRSGRTDIESQRVEKKAGLLKLGRAIDNEAKRVTALILEVENPLRAKKQQVDDERERIAREQAEQAERERLAEIEKARKIEEDRRRIEREAEQAKLAEERRKLDVERAALVEQQRKHEEAQRAEAERRDRLEAERKRQVAEAEQAERVRMAEEQRKEREKLAEERKALEHAQREARARELEARREQEIERAKIVTERAKLAKEEADRQAKIKAEREAVEKAERDRIAVEENRKAVLEAAKVRDARLKTLKPDREKMKAYAVALRSVAVPDLASKEAREFLGQCVEGVAAIAAKLEAF